MLSTEVAANTGRFVAEAHAVRSYSAAGIPLMISTAVPQGTQILFDADAIREVYFGPTQLIIDPYSGNNSKYGIRTIVLHLYCDLAVIDPSRVLVFN